MLYLTFTDHLPTDGTYRRETIAPAAAGALIAAANESSQLQVKLWHRSTANVVEELAGIKIPSTALHASKQSPIERLNVADVILCIRPKIGADKNNITAESLLFVQLERIK